MISAAEAVISVGERAGIPVFAADTATVERGAVAALGFDYYDHGRQTGVMVARVLNGENPETWVSRQWRSWTFREPGCR